MDLTPNFVNEIDQRIKNFKFKSSEILTDTWDGFPSVEIAQYEEKQQKFKSVEEQLIYRIELWIDMCRIESGIKNGVGITEKYATIRRSKSLTKNSEKCCGSPRTVETTRISSSKESRRFLTLGGKQKKSMEMMLQNNRKTSRSTADLPLCLEEIAKELNLSVDSLNTSECSSTFSQCTQDNTSSKHKSKLKLIKNLFRRKRTEKIAEEYRMTSKPFRKKNRKVIGDKVASNSKCETVKVKHQGLKGVIDLAKLNKNLRNSAPDISKLPTTTGLVRRRFTSNRRYSDDRVIWTAPNIIYINGTEQFI